MAATLNLSASEGSVEDKYELLEQLGTGAFSTVVRGVEKTTSQQVAVKIIDKKKIAGKEDALESEVTVMRMLNHSNIVQLLEIFESPRRFCIVLDLVTGGELFDRIVDRGTYTEKDASELMRQVLGAVEYMHSRNIVHRDLKPENLLYHSPSADSKIMISDFGLARVLREGETVSDPCGTPGYVAPEVLKRKPYSYPADCWSLGVICYILLCGYPPFYDDDDDVLFEQIMRGDFEYDSPYWDDISTSAKDFITKFMTMQPSRRMTAAQALQHEWIAGTTAKSIDIHASVAENIKKNFARGRWKKAINLQIALKRMQQPDPQ
eukprot:m.295733 g.295733  ORF g.295733 m.295733 type:complete len:321 (+) comp19516_c1_seq9:94-1056(+)